jgi:[ribosomal protein S5]-alanine N-acetyltransferase
MMLHGEIIQLRPIRQTDLDTLYLGLNDLQNRGDYFPANIHSESWLHKRFQETGFWSEDSGMLLIINPAAAIIGHIEFFKPVAYLDAYELSYLIYDLAERGKGATSEAVGLLTRYLFDNKKVNRLQLIIHPGNKASRRVAEKNGYLHEGTMCGAWYQQGRYHDVTIYALLRQDYDAARMHNTNVISSATMATSNGSVAIKHPG